MTRAEQPLRSGLSVLLGFSRPARAPLGASVALALVSTVLELVPYFVLATLVNRVVEGKAWSTDLPALAALAAIALAGRTALWAAAMYLSHVVAFRLLHDLQVRSDLRDHAPSGSFACPRGDETPRGHHTAVSHNFGA